MLPAGIRLSTMARWISNTLIRAMSTRPAELLGLPAGSLRAGSPADVIVIDADVPGVLDPADLKSSARTPCLTKRGFPDACRVLSSGDERCTSMSDRDSSDRQS